jgi:hypothetical protein
MKFHAMEIDFEYTSIFGTKYCVLRQQLQIYPEEVKVWSYEWPINFYELYVHI